MDEIICRDSRKLTDFVKPESVAMTVTSPPYRNAIDYQMHVKAGERSYRGQPIWETDSYLQHMKDVFDQVHEVTVPGGYCCIVIGFEVVKTEMVPIPHLLLTQILGDKSKKWKLREEIVWNKVTAGRRGAGNRFSVTVKSLKSETSEYLDYYTNIMHEYIFVLSKGDTKVRVRKKDTLKRIEKLGLHPFMYREVANSTWHITPVPPGTVKHPCPYPEQIPWRLIQMYSHPNDVVLDPMNGSGQTTKVAKHLNRHFIGVDSIREYVRLGRERLNEPLHLSTLQYVEKWGKLDSESWQGNSGKSG